MKIAPSIHRIGDKSIVNSYLVEESGEVTIIDAGVPGSYRDTACGMEVHWVSGDAKNAQAQCVQHLMTAQPRHPACATTQTKEAMENAED